MVRKGTILILKSRIEAILTQDSDYLTSFASTVAPNLDPCVEGRAFFLFLRTKPYYALPGNWASV